MTFNRRAAPWIVLCLLLLAGTILATYRIYDKHYVSGAERNAAIRAAYGIDDMGALEISKTVYSRREEEARRLLAIAHIAARTQKDKIALIYLDMYFSSVQGQRGMSDIQNNDLQMLETLSATDPRRDYFLKSSNSAEFAYEHLTEEAVDERSRLMGELE